MQDAQPQHISTAGSTQKQAPLPHFRLWQLISPALPIGSFTYSQGLEQAVAMGWVCDEASTGEWLDGLLLGTLAHLDLPVLARLHGALSAGDAATARHWQAFLASSRETMELLDEDRELGLALARLLESQHVEGATELQREEPASLAASFALACVRWHIPRHDALGGYLWLWGNGQIAAAVKLVPLGQSAGQRLLARLLARIPEACAIGATLADDDIGSSAPGFAIASALHETHHARLFRA